MRIIDVVKEHSRGMRKMWKRKELKGRKYKVHEKKEQKENGSKRNDRRNTKGCRWRKYTKHKVGVLVKHTMVRNQVSQGDEVVTKLRDNQQDEVKWEKWEVRQGREWKGQYHEVRSL